LHQKYADLLSQTEPPWLSMVPNVCHSDAMDLTSYVDQLGRELTTLMETGGDDARALVERVNLSLESAIRLTLLDALSGATDEITRELAPGSVELRLRGRDPKFIVTAPSPDQAAAAATAPDGESAYTTATAEGVPPGVEDGATTRINVRLPEQLKVAIEDAAGKEGRSVNAWLVRAASAALQGQRPERHGKRGSQRHTGWAR